MNKPLFIGIAVGALVVAAIVVMRSGSGPTQEGATGSNTPTVSQQTSTTNPQPSKDTTTAQSSASENTSAAIDSAVSGIISDSANTSALSDQESNDGTDVNAAADTYSSINSTSYDSAVQ